MAAEATRGRGRLSTVLLTGAAATCAALALAAHLTGAVRPLELDTVDARFSLRGQQQPPAGVVVVAIDDATYRDLDTFPIPRSDHARVIDRLRRAGVRAIAYDVQFTEQTTVDEDNALVGAVGRTPGRIVLATTEVGPGGSTRVLGGDDALQELGARAAAAAVPPDADGVDRRFPYEVDGLTGFAVSAVETATGTSVRRARFRDDGTAWVDFAGPPGTIPHVSFGDVLAGRADTAKLRDRIAVVGATAITLQDLHATAARGGLMSGPELMANAIATVEEGIPLRDAPGFVGVLAIVLAACALPLSALRLRPLLLPLAALALAAAWWGIAQLAFGAGWILPLAAPLLALVLGLPAALGGAYAHAAAERQRVRDVFARFVPARVVDEVLARTDGDLRLGGRRLQATILFCDLRGFTTFAESLPAETVLTTLNRYLDEMTAAVHAHDGTLLTYQGDGLFAAFGAPLEQLDHADRAVAAAREMCGVRLERFNAWLREQGLGVEAFRMGVGLNSGVVMSGNIGSAAQLTYTAVGDTVNTAARLEAMTKGTPHQVLISDTTRAMLRRDAPDLVYVDAVEVRGRKAKVNLWTFTPPEPAR